MTMHQKLWIQVFELCSTPKNGHQCLFDICSTTCGMTAHKKSCALRDSGSA